MRPPKDIKLLSGTSSRPLMLEIAQHLKVEPTEHLVSRFKDGEIRVQILENIRGHDVFIVQSTHPPADNLLELLLLIDAAKRASAKRITAVIPYFGYGRQDRKDQPRVPISAKLVSNLIEVAGANRVLTVDLHADQIQGFFDIPVDNLFASPIFKEFFKGLSPETHTVVAPDVGASKRARAIARKLGDLPLAIIDKRRPAPNQAEVLNIIGHVEGRHLIIVDDIIDTGNTVIEGAKALITAGALSVVAAASHALLSGDAPQKIEDSPIEKVIVTDTIPTVWQRKTEKIEVLSIAPLLAEAIRRIHNEESISALFI